MHLPDFLSALRALIPGLANGETRATKSPFVFCCAIFDFRRSRDQYRAVRQGSTLSAMWGDCARLAIELERERCGVDVIRRA